MHPAEISAWSDVHKFSGGSSTMSIYEKICLEAYINNQYIWLKNDTAQYFMLEFFKYIWYLPTGRGS